MFSFDGPAVAETGASRDSISSFRPATSPPTSLVETPTEGTPAEPPHPHDALPPAEPGTNIDSTDSTVSSPLTPSHDSATTVDLDGAKKDPPLTNTKRSSLIRGKRLDRDLTTRARGLLDGIGLPDLARVVHVLWNSRLQTTAGMADACKQEITLNPKLLDIDPSELEGTLRHELAHLVAYHRAGSRRIQAHGSEWRAACAELGIPNEKRCHELPFKGRRHRPKFAYRCQHCLAVYPRTRKLRRHSACYTCCSRFNRGRYSDRFLLKEVPLSMLPDPSDD